MYGDTWVFDAEAGEWSSVEAGVSIAEEEDASSSILGFPVVSIILAVLFFLALANSRN
jgi:hypothetical protein